MLSISLSSFSSVFERIAFLFPVQFSLEGYVQVFEQTPFFTWLRNSLIVSVLLTFGQLILGVMTAYAFARYQFFGREVVFFFVLCTMMIPPQAIMLPAYLVINFFDWINTYKGVIIPHLANGYAIFVLRQFFLQIPKELEESAQIDGCNDFQTLYHIYLRPSINVLIGVAVIQFVNNWNDYYWPLLVLMDQQKMTLPVAIVQFRNEAFVEWVPTMAAATMSILPVVIIYMFAQRYFTEGFLRSGIK